MAGCNPSYYLLRWSDHLSNYADMFVTLREQEELVDCSLACDDGVIPAHKLVLAGCSPYLRHLFKQHSTNPHPIIFLVSVSRSTVLLLLEFIYKGQAHIPPNELQQLIALGRTLKIKGLSQINMLAKVPQSLQNVDIPRLHGSPELYGSQDRRSHFTRIDDVSEHNNVSVSGVSTPSSLRVNSPLSTPVVEDMQETDGSIYEDDMNHDNLHNEEGQENVNETILDEATSKDKKTEVNKRHVEQLKDAVVAESRPEEQEISDDSNKQNKVPVKRPLFKTKGSSYNIKKTTDMGKRRVGRPPKNSQSKKGSTSGKGSTPSLAIQVAKRKVEASLNDEGNKSLSKKQKMDGVTISHIEKTTPRKQMVSPQKLKMAKDVNVLKGKDKDGIKKEKHIGMKRKSQNGVQNIMENSTSFEIMRYNKSLKKEMRNLVRTVGISGCQEFLLSKYGVRVRDTSIKKYVTPHILQSAKPNASKKAKNKKPKKSLSAGVVLPIKTPTKSPNAKKTPNKIVQKSINFNVSGFFGKKRTSEEISRKSKSLNQKQPAE